MCELCGGGGDISTRFMALVEAITTAELVRDALKVEQAEVISRTLEAMDAMGLEVECPKCRGFGLFPKAGVPGFVDWESWLRQAGPYDPNQEGDEA